MLLGNFFTISETNVADNNLQAKLQINASHQIFDGHFPGQPVVPGVCMLQMIKELMEEITGKKMQLRKADFLKFLAVIDPLQNPEVLVEATFGNNEHAEITVNGRFFKDAATFLKFRVNFASQD